MAIYALADLHLAMSFPGKTMEVFGGEWKDYMSRIRENCMNILTPDDTLLIPGDLSWATYLKDAVEDFSFIDSLPGTKIICRGNHDYYWTTVKKMEEFFAAEGFGTIKIARHNAIRTEGALITGTRGWKMPGDDDFTEQDRKIYDREKERMKLCLSALSEADSMHELTHIVMLHYPPLTNVRMKTELSELIETSGADICLYGHLHGRARQKVFEGAKESAPGTVYKCVSADYLGFRPLRIL